MYIGTKSHGKKIFHHPQCAYVSRIRGKNKVFFYAQGEAREKGYRICNCCSRMGKYYRKEKNQIQDFAKKNRMKIWLYDGSVYLETEVAPWKIIAAGQQHKMFLYHGNHERYENLNKKNGMIQYHYHSQNDARSKSILGYMNYIVRHDRWREEIKDEYKRLPKNTKKQRELYNHKKKRARRNAIHYVHNLIEKLKLENSYAVI